MRKSILCQLGISKVSELIDEWIFSERDHILLKRFIIDGITYENLAEEFDLSVRGVKYIIKRCVIILLNHTNN